MKASSAPLPMWSTSTDEPHGLDRFRNRRDGVLARSPQRGRYRRRRSIGARRHQRSEWIQRIRAHRDCVVCTKPRAETRCGDCQARLLADMRPMLQRSTVLVWHAKRLHTNRELARRVLATAAIRGSDARSNGVLRATRARQARRGETTRLPLHFRSTTPKVAARRTRAARHHRRIRVLGLTRGDHEMTTEHRTEPKLAGEPGEMIRTAFASFVHAGLDAFAAWIDREYQRNAASAVHVAATVESPEPGTAVDEAAALARTSIDSRPPLTRSGLHFGAASKEKSRAEPSTIREEARRMSARSA